MGEEAAVGGLLSVAPHETVGGHRGDRALTRPVGCRTWLIEGVSGSGGACLSTCEGPLKAAKHPYGHNLTCWCGQHQRAIQVMHDQRAY